MAPPQLPLGIQLRDSATLDNYFPGANAELVDRLRQLVVQPGDRQPAYFLWGGDGVGKTHLLQAACHLAAQARKTAVFLPLRQLRDSGPGLLEGFIALDLVCIDDVDAIGGDRGWEAALVALYDGVRANGGHLLTSARNAPAELNLTVADLRSRLAWGPVYAVRPLDDTHKLSLLQQRARARGLDMPDEVARFLLARAPREVAALLALLDRLDHASLAAQRRLTVPFVRDVLAGAD
jgi:DnaA family protein